MSDAYTAREYIHPGRPDGAVAETYDFPNVVVVEQDSDPAGRVASRGRKIKLEGGWTLRQYRNPVPCGAHYILTPDPGATYTWESQS